MLSYVNSIHAHISREFWIRGDQIRDISENKVLVNNNEFTVMDSLTHICLVDYSIFINWTSLFLI